MIKIYNHETGKQGFYEQHHIMITCLTKTVEITKLFVSIESKNISLSVFLKLFLIASQDN